MEESLVQAPRKAEGLNVCKMQVQTKVLTGETESNEPIKAEWTAVVDGLVGRGK